MTKGTNVKLHAAGREDVDVRMLCAGRPFIIEIKEPKLRKIDLEKLKWSVNLTAEGKIEIDALKFTSKEAVRRLKEGEKANKVYRAVVEFASELSEEEMLKIEALNDRLINQQTPTRVVHRRALRTRKRYVYGVKMKRLKPNRLEMRVHCQGGLYIKELVSGDEGRTTPSVAEIVGISAKCVELDVMKVEVEVS
jgi:tRNA pseudouridine synthase 10